MTFEEAESDLHHAERMLELAIDRVDHAQDLMENALNLYLQARSNHEKATQNTGL